MKAAAAGETKSFQLFFFDFNFFSLLPAEQETCCLAKFAGSGGVSLEMNAIVLVGPIPPTQSNKHGRRARSKLYTVLWVNM